MKLLNVGCGGQRPQDPIWTNLDELHSILPLGTPERTNLDAEKNYVDHKLLSSQMPFDPDYFDGICLIHVLEHFSCHDAVTVLKECRRVMKPGGLLFASVPDAAYFWKKWRVDTKANAELVFGEPIHDAGHETFMSYALFRYDHVQVLSESGLMCLMFMAGFSLIDGIFDDRLTGSITRELAKMLNRRKFSAEVVAIK